MNKKMPISGVPNLLIFLGTVLIAVGIFQLAALDAEFSDIWVFFPMGVVFIFHGIVGKLLQ